MTEQLFVVKIINTDSVPLRYWYRKKGGSLFICRYNHQLNQFGTVDFINDEGTVGYIQREHCKVVCEFDYEE